MAEKKLYNAEQKQRYIDKKQSEVTLAPNFLYNLFIKSAPFEESFGKDVSDWTVSEIIEFYMFIDTYSVEFLAVLHSNYSLYTNWCLTETLVADGQNHFQEVNNSDLIECVNTSLLEKTIITREEFEKSVDTLLNDTDKFAFYAIFEGIAGYKFEEITNIKLSDIEGDELHLCTGRTIPVSSKFREIIENAANEEIYQSYAKERYYPFRPDDTAKGLVYRMAKNVNGNDQNDIKNRSQTFNRRYQRCIDYMGLPSVLTPKKLMASGKIDFIKQLMKQSGLSLNETLRKYKDVINDRYPVEKFQTSYASFLRKYQNAFESEQDQS